MSDDHGCKCGNYSATAAGYRQMTPDARAKFDRGAANCRTCRYDRKAGIR